MPNLHRLMVMSGAAAIGFACLTSSAAAQDKQTALEKTEALLNSHDLMEWVVQHAGVKPGAKADGVIRMDGESAPIPTGWVYGDATYCGFYTPDSLKDQWFYDFVTQKGTIVYTFYSVNDVYIAQGLAVPCGAGNEIGVHVTSSAGAYDKTQSFPNQ